MGQDVKDRSNGSDSRGWREKWNRKLGDSLDGRKLRNSLDGCPPRNKNSPRSDNDDKQQNTDVQTTQLFPATYFVSLCFWAARYTYIIHWIDTRL